MEMLATASSVLFTILGFLVICFNHHYFNSMAALPGEISVAANCSFQETWLNNETSGHKTALSKNLQQDRLLAIRYYIWSTTYITLHGVSSHSVHIKQQLRQLTSTAQSYGKYLLRSCRKTGKHIMK